MGSSMSSNVSAARTRTKHATALRRDEANKPTAACDSSNSSLGIAVFQDDASINDDTDDDDIHDTAATASTVATMMMIRHRSPSPRSVVTAFHHHPPLHPHPHNRHGPAATSMLLRLICTRDWDAVRFRLASHPRDAAYVDNDEDDDDDDDDFHDDQSRRTRFPTTSKGGGGGKTPLRAACLYRAPHDIVLQLISAWPVALWTQDSEGWIPPARESLALITTPTNTSRCGRHYCRNNTGRHDDCVDSCGWSHCGNDPFTVRGCALHLACRHGTSVRVLAELLLQNPNCVHWIPNHQQPPDTEPAVMMLQQQQQQQSSSVADGRSLEHTSVRSHGHFPANLLYRQHHYQIQQQQRHTFLSDHHGNPSDHQNTTNDYDTHRVCDLELLQRLNLLIAASQGRPILNTTDDDRWFRLGDPNHPLYTLHDVIAFQLDCCSNNSSSGSGGGHDADFCSFYIHMYPDAAAVVDVSTGRMPLHTAVAAAALPTTSMTTSTLPSTTGYRDALVLKILNAHPAAAAVHDHDGRLPLHMALSPVSSTISNRRCSLRLSWSLVAQLIAAHPSAVECPCPDTGLLPFALAAAVVYPTAVVGAAERPLNVGNHSTLGNEVANNNDMSPLDVCYELLRACPQMLSQREMPH